MNKAQVNKILSFFFNELAASVDLKSVGLFNPFGLTAKKVLLLYFDSFSINKFII